MGGGTHCEAASPAVAAAPRWVRSYMEARRRGREPVGLSCLAAAQEGRQRIHTEAGKKSRREHAECTKLSGTLLFGTKQNHSKNATRKKNWAVLKKKAPLSGPSSLLWCRQAGKHSFISRLCFLGCYKTWPPDTQRLPDPHVCTGWFLATFFTADTESHAVGHRGQGAPYCGLNEGKAESDRRGDAPKSCSSGISMGGRTLGEGGRAQELRNGSAGSRFVPPRPTVWGAQVAHAV